MSGPPAGAGPHAGTPPASSVRPALTSGTRAALTIAVVGIALYVVLDVIAQLLPPHYSPISQAESDLAVGPYGYVMAANFVVRGLLTFAFLFGLVGASRLGKTARVGLALIALWGAGAFILAAFPTDVGTMVTVHGMIHNSTAAVAFLGGAFGTLFLSLHFNAEERLRPIAATARILASLGVVMCFVTLGALFIRRLSHVFGLVERVFIGLVLLWILIVALQLLLSYRPHGTAPTA
jgi:hypothetical protein